MSNQQAGYEYSCSCCQRRVTPEVAARAYCTACQQEMTPTSPPSAPGQPATRGRRNASSGAAPRGTLAPTASREGN